MVTGLTLGNVGLSFRLFNRCLLFALSVWVAPHVPTLSEVARGWEYPRCWAAGAMLTLTPLTVVGKMLQRFN